MRTTSPLLALVLAASLTASGGCGLFFGDDDPVQTNPSGPVTSSPPPTMEPPPPPEPPRLRHCRIVERGVPPFGLHFGKDPLIDRLGAIDVVVIVTAPVAGFQLLSMTFTLADGSTRTAMASEAEVGVHQVIFTDGFPRFELTFDEAQPFLGGPVGVAVTYLDHEGVAATFDGACDADEAGASVTALAELDGGTLLLGTADSGLYSAADLDAEPGEFALAPLPVDWEGGSIQHIRHGPVEGDPMWLAATNGLYLLDEATLELVHLPGPAPAHGEAPLVEDVVVVDSQTAVVLRGGALFRVELDQDWHGTWTLLSELSVTAVAVDGPDLWFVGRPEPEGTTRLERLSEVWLSADAPPEPATIVFPPKSAADNPSALVVDGWGRLWIGGARLLVLDPGADELRDTTLFSVSSLTLDSRGTLWMGTRDTCGVLPLSLLDPAEGDLAAVGDELQVARSPVRELVELADGRLAAATWPVWASTNGELGLVWGLSPCEEGPPPGLALIDPETLSLTIR